MILLYLASSLTRHMGVLSLAPRVELPVSSLCIVPAASICSVLLQPSNEGGESSAVSVSSKVSSSMGGSLTLLVVLVLVLG